MRHHKRPTNNASFFLLLVATTWVVVEQPPTSPTSPAGSAQEIPEVPSLQQLPTLQEPAPTQTMPSTDPNSDPLFLEIKKMLMKDKFDSESPSNQAAAKAIDLMTKVESIHESKWDALQHLVLASQQLNRSIELDLAANRLDQAVKDRSVLKQIRVLILSLLVD